MVVLTLAAVADKTGTITVYNQTPEPIYVVIAGRNQGQVDAWSYGCYSFALGEHRVEASTSESYAVKYVRISDTYPDNSWTVYPGDF